MNPLKNKLRPGIKKYFSEFTRYDHVTLSMLSLNHLATCVTCICGFTRESCGICGFLSPSNTEIQRAPDGSSFSDPGDQDFRCGNTKPIAELTNDEPTKRRKRIAGGEDSSMTAVAVGVSSALSSEPISDNLQLFHIYCGGTIISDRWILSSPTCLFPYSA
jgi:hypothetical protein